MAAGNKIKTVSGTSGTQILFATQPSMAVGVVMAQAGATGTTQKIHKAGTPVAGDLTARTTAFTVAADSGSPSASNAIGVLLHDVDVTAGDENATVLIFGYVDLNKVESDVEAKITTTVKAALDGKVTFLK